MAGNGRATAGLSRELEEDISEVVDRDALLERLHRDLR